MRNFTHAFSRTVQMVAVSSVLAALAACGSSGSVHSDAGGGSGPGGNPGGPPGGASSPNAATEALQTTIQHTADTVGAISPITNDAGDVLGDVISQVPLLAGAAAPTTTVLTEVGRSVDALSTGLHQGLGQIGSTPDPVGTTLTSLEGVVDHAGNAVSGVGDLVQGAGTRLGPLGQVTDVTGGAVNQVGGAVSQVGQSVGDLITSGPVSQVTGTTSKIVTPVLVQTVGVVQAVGNTTGVGQPINNLLTAVGGGVTTLGNNVQGTQIPIIAPTGNLVGELGQVVSTLGGLTQTGDGAAPSSPLKAPLLGGVLPGNGELLGGALGNLLPGGGLLSTAPPTTTNSGAAPSLPLSSGLLGGGLLGGNAAEGGTSVPNLLSNSPLLQPLGQLLGGLVKPPSK